jgi:hypothetical protein
MPRAKDDQLNIAVAQLANIEKVLEKAAARTPPPLTGHYDFVTKFWPRIDQMLNSGRSAQTIADELNKDFEKIGIAVKLDAKQLDHAIRSVKRNQHRSS